MTTVYRLPIVKTPVTIEAIICGVLSLIIFCSLPRLLPPFWVSIVAYGLIYGLAGLGFNLLLRYTGLLSFGHAAYFATGAYAVALAMRFFSIYSFEHLLLIALGATFVISAIFGFICVRHTRIYFAILTCALSMLIYTLILKFYHITRGTDGLWVAMPKVFGIDFRGIMARPVFNVHVLYYLIFALYVLSVIIMWVIVNSPFGKALQAIRDSEVRAEFVGIRVKLYRWYAFIISGLYCGLAGFLYAFLNYHIGPEISYWTFSGEIVFVTILGGFHYFIGPLVGGLVYMFIRTYAWGITIWWALILGSFLIACVLLLPGGIVGGARIFISRMIAIRRGIRRLA